MVLDRVPNIEVLRGTLSLRVVPFGRMAIKSNHDVDVICVLDIDEDESPW